MSYLLTLSLLAFASWYWQHGVQLKLSLRQRLIEHCKKEGVQYLDDSLQQEKVWLGRNRSGRVTLLRQYRFEFATDGEFRYQGKVLLSGRRLEKLHLDPHPFNRSSLTY